jgi:hypothetical protein
MSLTFEITKEMLPTGKVSVVMRKPLYQDLRKARRNYPFDRNESSRVGYMVDDLLLAAQIVSINGQSVEGCRDTIDRLKSIPAADRQALSSLMVEMFFLTKEKANEALDKARAARIIPQEYYDVLTEESPNKSLACRFMDPSSEAQMQCEQRFTTVNKHGCGLEEFMFAYCLINLNGADVSFEKDRLNLLDHCEIADVQYAVNFFVGLSSLDEDSRSDLKKHAHSLLQQLQKSPVGTTITTSSPTAPLF